MITNQSLVRNINKRRVIQQVFNNLVISRSQIAKNLDLNKVTVSEIVSESIKQHYFNELGKGMSSTRGGRKPTMLEFNAGYGFVMSFDMGFDYVDSLVSLINGKMIQFTHHQVNNLTVDQRIELMVDEAEHVEENLKTVKGLMGIAIAIHGIVDKNKVIFTPYIDFESTDIAQIIEEKIHVPVILQNEANLSVIYERDFECVPQVDNLVCISVHKGIGVGIILNNKLYTGIHGEAGEVGHSIVYESIEGEKSRYTSSPIEKYCSEDSIIQRIRSETDLSYLSYDGIRQMYNNGDDTVIQIMDEFCFYIAGLIYNLIITLDPEKVVISSNLVNSIPELIDKIKTYIPSLISSRAQVEVSKNSKYAILLGGVSLIVAQVLSMSPGELNFVQATSY